MFTSSSRGFGSSDGGRSGFVVAALALEVETCEEINSPGGSLGVARMSPVKLISLFSLTLPEYNSNDHRDHSIIQQYYFCKRGPIYFAYIILRFSFFSSCEKNVFIRLARSRN